MKKFNLLLVSVLLTCSTAALFGQISQGGVPMSKTNGLSLEEVPTHQLPAFNIEEVRAEDEEEEKTGNYPKIGRVRPVELSPSQFGEWTELESGGRLWRGSVKSRDALALSVHFESFNLPSGASLFLYSPDFKNVIGAFTEFNNNESGIFATELILSDEVVVEYFEPTGVENNQPFTISGVVHAYRMVPGAEESSQRDFGDSDGCQVNVNCSEGNSWQDEKRGVARILIVDGQSAGWCTGSLINNTAEDCTPYFLTALHCAINTSAASMNQWIFYFNYESSGCSNGSSGQVPNNTVQGCARIADSNDGGGNNGSDYLLVEINNSIPDNYNPYYNGWRRSSTTSSSGVSIHHPAGDIKKISTYSSNLQSTTWGGPSGSHWLVNWSSTNNGFGVTEGGSSGSPIFDSNGLIIGTLTGGSSFCTSPNSPDLYGKMSYHWSSNPGDDLSTYLDPIGTGATSLSGTNQPCGSDPTCVADIPYPESDPCVQTVIADDPNCCNVAWDAACETAYETCNSAGDDCEAGTVSASLSQDICPGETGIFDATGVTIPADGIYGVQFTPDGGTGGNETGFSITDVAPLPFEFDADINGILSDNSLPELSGTWLVTGFIFTDPDDLAGSVCSFTEVDITLNFLSAGDPACNGGSGEENDDCADAIVVTPGTYPFSTANATTDGPDQPGSACDAFEESNVNNDVWYEYTATCDGTASFSTCSTADFDTRLAVYPGGQCPPSAASLIICNDDGDGCDDFSSFLEWQVIQGETYLLRIGGYSAADAGTGTFELIEDCGNEPGCAADIPYPEDDPCVVSVIAADDFCCNTEWDNVCEDAYLACSDGGGDDCEAGTVSADLSQDICPGELGVFNATGVTIPDGGIYAVQFVPDGGTGGNGTGFSITDVAPLPFEFDADINGVMSGNGLPELSGTWLATGFIFTDPDDIAGSVCSTTAVDITLNFLSAGDPACDGGSGEENDDCADATVVTPGTYPFSTANATTDGPDQPGSACDAFEESNVNNDVWYEYTATCDGTASFSTCSTADFDTRLAVYPGGQCPPSAASLIICNDDGDGCDDFSSFLEWQVVQGETYLLRIGGYSAADAGTGTFELIEDCGNSGSEECLDWVSPSPTTGWNNFNTDFGGAPANEGDGCPVYTTTDFEVWMSEAYAMDNVVEGTSYTFSHCEGPGAGSWIPEYTIIAPSGAIDAWGEGDGDGCSITWVASESGSYLIVINELDNCGVDSEINNGFPAITCNDGVTSVLDHENSPSSFEVFPNPNNGQFNILFAEATGNAHVDVLEVSGKIVKSVQYSISEGAILPLDLGANAKGMYFVRITMNNQVEVKQVVVH